MQHSVVNAGGEETKNNFCMAILTSWDFGLIEKGAVKIKKGLIKNELQVFFHRLHFSSFDGSMNDIPLMCNLELK